MAKSSNQKAEPITVVAELSVQWSGSEPVIIHSYDKAWHLAKEHLNELPVRSRFLGFVRKED
jgi:hypothetical protein